MGRGGGPCAPGQWASGGAGQRAGKHWWGAEELGRRAEGGGRREEGGGSVTHALAVRAHVSKRMRMRMHRDDSRSCVLNPWCLALGCAQVRHGAVVMVAELLPALQAAAAADPAANAGCWPLSAARAGEVANLVPAIDKARLYRGKGGEVGRGLG